ncbi:hypothetical protein, partial [[Clostridium] innocuum]|uniref:hypothetical protein n=1 Tax=Clostridium innocuum TaxID=1522 RepID=UPI0005D21A0A
ALSVNNISAGTHVPLNREADSSSIPLEQCKEKFKTIDLGMGDYKIDSFTKMPISPRSYGKPSPDMKPSSSAMTLFGKFVES